MLSCYEAGRDGFWLHRFLESEHITNLVVDSASIEVSRRGKQVKTDRLDVEKLLSMLLRYHAGETRVWSVVHVPSLAAEDHRQLHRQLLALKGERTRYVNRIKGLLVGQGIHLAVDAEFLTRLPKLRLWDGSPLPAGLLARLQREFTCWQFVHGQILDLEAERRAVVRSSQEACVAQVRQLLRLKGIGENSAWLYVMEFFGWREFHNRREIGALAGLTPTPFQSGADDHEQGIRNRHEISPSSWKLSTLMVYCPAWTLIPSNSVLPSLNLSSTNDCVDCMRPLKPKSWVMAASLRWPVRRGSRGRP